MPMPTKLRPSHWLGAALRWKRAWLPAPPSLPPLLNPSSLMIDDCALQPGPSFSSKERMEFLASISSCDLTDQIGATDIALRVGQVLRHINREFEQSESGRASPNVFSASGPWTYWHALTWFAHRFRPRSYLEISTDLGASLAMVAMNSPETVLVNAEFGRPRTSKMTPDEPGRIARELARAGSCQPLTFVGGNSHRSLPRYFSKIEMPFPGSRLNGVREFDLILLDGSLTQSGVYQDLKNVFGRCAPGGMVVYRGMDRQDARLPGQYRPRLQGFWERLPLRFPGFRYLKAPGGSEVGLAWRSF